MLDKCELDVAAVAVAECIAFLEGTGRPEDEWRQDVDKFRTGSLEDSYRHCSYVRNSVEAYRRTKT